MKLIEVKEQLITLINAGSPTIDMKYHDRQVEAMIPSLRQEAILVRYNGGIVNGIKTAGSYRINGAWVQKFSVTIDASIQENDLEYLRVITAAPIMINSNVSGDVYVGKNKSTNQFKVCQTRDELQTLKTRGFVDNGKNIIVLFSDGEYEIYGDKMLKNFYRESVLANPVDKPGFNLVTDEYPVSEDLLLIMADIYKQKMGIAIQQTKDPVIDQTVTSERGNVKANLR